MLYVTKNHQDMQIIASDSSMAGTAADVLGAKLVLCGPACPRTILVGWVIWIDNKVHLATSNGEIRWRTWAERHRLRTVRGTCIPAAASPSGGLSRRKTRDGVHAETIPTGSTRLRS
jgi:NADH:ubiquinone oxidoreductase subunit